LFDEIEIYNCVPIKLRAVTWKGQLSVVVVHAVPTEIVAERSCADVTAAEGDDVTLECHVTGSPAPRVSWYGKTAALLGEGGHVHVENVSRHDTGSYQCVADNGVGVPASCHASLTVECKNNFHHHRLSTIVVYFT